MSNLLNNFLRGLLLLVPMAAAIYVVVYLYNFLDNLIPVVKNIPGLSFVLVVLFITMVGSFARRYNTGMINWFENIIKDIPLLNLVYSSIKDLMTSFMGEKKKFNKPVLVKVESSLYKPGFVTSNDLKEIGLPGKVSVYLPHSYNFSGNVFITDKKNVIPLKNSSSEVMKYIVSGGISGSIKA
ncbi:MAG: DUF502 domain-containing protein [Cytophagales bacterium]|nr:MAG: hypothetical protein CND58_00090 [Rhodothermaeota bacterium MED-G16]